jgi:hypothetical protein
MDPGAPVLSPSARQMNAHAGRHICNSALQAKLKLGLKRSTHSQTVEVWLCAMRSITALMLDTSGFVGWPKAAVITLVVARWLCSGAASSGKVFGRTCGRGVVTWRLAILTARGSFFASVFGKHLQALTGFVNNILSSYRFVK